MPKKLLIFVVAYNAENHLSAVLSRIPAKFFTDLELRTEILVIDDSSRDATFDAGLKFKEQFANIPLTVLKNPQNLGYGGNQKLGYAYAIEKGFDYVALLHGDGQYAPEILDTMLEPLVAGQADAVFGSRMLNHAGALQGGMPRYKFYGNRILSVLQNLLSSTKLSEWHTGYRIYATQALKQIPFERNSNDFDFDTDIILQLLAGEFRIKEISIPTKYGDEVCHVNGPQYAFKVLKSCFQYRCQQSGIFYDPKFDAEVANSYYPAKFDFVSSHSIALACVNKNDACLLLGSGPLPLVAPFAEKSKRVSVVDYFPDPLLSSVASDVWVADLDEFQMAEETTDKVFTKVLILDVIEHLKSPETFLEKLRSAPSCQGAEIIITTPNIAFLPMRVMLALGAFNYGKRGILDRTHTRLFTVGSLRRILVQSGFTITSLRGIPPPYPLALGDNIFSRTLLYLHGIATYFLKRIFGFQIFVSAIPNPTVQRLLSDAINHSELEVGKLRPSFPNNGECIQ